MDNSNLTDDYLDLYVKYAVQTAEFMLREKNKKCIVCSQHAYKDDTQCINCGGTKFIHFDKKLDLTYLIK